ncbi:winged helix-turn-helix domain-containing protein [Salinirubellus sp. GCM10025818]|uniref:winged helix-turn-helix domain-containing protein n=1 Tax=Salinirubellus TaxID=2162630 RepID=UPI0030D244B4
MSSPVGSVDHDSLTPDEAFSILGNETRMQILQELGNADRSLSFTDLRDRVGIRQGAQFNYHLDKLVGHFVEKVGEGYTLREPGRRVIQSVLSGAVTDDPVLEPAEVDFSCLHCGGPLEVSYSRGKLRLSCTACVGDFDESTVRERENESASANLANMWFTPAGVQGRDAADALRTASTTNHLDAMALSSDICPRCSARVDHSVSVCESHDADGGLCEACGSRLAVWFHFRCTNCIYDKTCSAGMVFLDVPELLVFVGEHGLNTSSRAIEWGWEFEEEIVSVDPFEGRFTFTIEADSITLTVDDTLSVVDVTKRSPSEPA